MMTGSGQRTTFQPGQPWPDNHGVPINAHGGGVLYHDGVYYWYGEHMGEGSQGNHAHVGVHCYSSADLYNWTDEGVALPVSTDPTSKLAAGCILQRPKVIYHASTGKFVMWFHHEFLEHLPRYATAASGVAVADSPTGPFVYRGSARPNAGAYPQNVVADQKQPLDEATLTRLASLHLPGGRTPDYPADMLFRRDIAGGQMARDMTLFVDDDGTAYHVYSSEDNGTLHISRLSDDYLTSSGQYVRVFPGRFHEAPAICKSGGRYWMISSDCTSWEPNAARAAVADKLFGPWTELGNPTSGINPQNGLGPEKTFGGQSTFILPVHGRDDAFIAMFDLWHPQNAIDGRYAWLPIRFADDRFTIGWIDEWDLGIFDRSG